jgi:hypothetical protein
MANLYGRMKDTYKSGATDVTRTASTEIRSRLETWEGSVETFLDRDGNFAVYIGSKHNPNNLVAKGNVNEEV